jgi:rubrerythrin
MKPKSKRPKFYAFMANESMAQAGYTTHYSKEAAERHYGDVTRWYRGNASSDYHLTILTEEEWRQAVEVDKEFKVDTKTRIIFLK